MHELSWTDAPKNQVAMKMRQKNKVANKRSSSRYRFQLLAFLQELRSQPRVAAIFLGLIIVPSSVLGYLSWRAIENERELSRSRLSESYQQFARLAAREIDKDLEHLGQRLLTSINAAIGKDGKVVEGAVLDELVAREPLIASCFVLNAPGQIAYPDNLRLRQEGTAAAAWEKTSYMREHELFESLVSRAEDLEYNQYNLDDAISTYQEIVVTISNPKLIAMAYSYIGRAQMKKGEWHAALVTFRGLLSEFPEIRDTNNLYLRFVAQFQISVCLENLGRDRDAVVGLLELNEDLLERSDAIHRTQFTFFLGEIQNLASRLLVSPELQNAMGYEKSFSELADRNKRRISEKYFIESFDRVLARMIIGRQQYRPRLRFISETAKREPFLLAYRALPDAGSIYASGLIGMQIDLDQLGQELFSTTLNNLKSGKQVTLGLINENPSRSFGRNGPSQGPTATHDLQAPLDFWQVAVYLDQDAALSSGIDFSEAVRIWLIGVLLLSILTGAYIFIRRARRAAYLSQLKTSFVSNVSHELRTPVASINMLAELMEMQLAGDSNRQRERFESEASQYLGVIQRECRRLTRLVESILDFSKLERGVRQYDFQPKNPAEAIRDAAEVFRPHAESQGFELELAVPSSLAEVRLDADALSQAILNLLSNSVKYSEGIKKIRIQALETDSHVMIQVIDRGMGIPRSEIPRIFEEFYRGNQRLNAKKKGGLGLGLTLVNDIISAHGGDVSVTSKVGKGSTFSIKLPKATKGESRDRREDQVQGLKNVIPGQVV